MRGLSFTFLVALGLLSSCARLIGADFDRPAQADGARDAANSASNAGDGTSRQPSGDGGDAADVKAVEVGDSTGPVTDGGGDRDVDEIDRTDASDAIDDTRTEPDAPIPDAGASGPPDAGGQSDASDDGVAPDSGAGDGGGPCMCANDHVCCGGSCKPIDATNCFACNAVCPATQPICALDVRGCACTATSCADGQSCVAGVCLPSSVLPMAAQRRWTPYPTYGTVQTSFADVDHDGRADAIAVDTTGIRVYRASPNGGFVANIWKTTGPFLGAHGTHFVDVTGDGCADAIAVGDTSIIVRRSNCTDAFGASETWGPRDDQTWLTTFADANGDGCADAIDVEGQRDVVRVALPCPAPPGTAARFNPNLEPWTENAYYGAQGTFFADVTGDGKVDAIVLNRYAGTTGITVRRSTGTQFLPNEQWTLDTLDGASALLFGDVTGDGAADLVAVKADGAYMLRANRWFLGEAEPLSDTPFSPSPSIRGDLFALADVTADGRADLIQVNDDALWVNVTVDRRIPIRFVQLVSDATSALAPKQLDDAVAAANAVFRPAAIQFFIRSSSVVSSLTLHDLTGPAASPADLAAASSPFNPSCDIGTDLGGLPPAEQMKVVATRCSLDGEVLIYVAHMASSTALLPWEGKAFFMDPADLAPAAASPSRLAHELGHYLGLPHAFGCCGDTALSHPDLVVGNVKDPSTGGAAPLSLFWDLVYAPSQMMNVMFRNASDAAWFESSLIPIQATGTTQDLTAGWYCPSADVTRPCAAAAPPGTICLEVSASGGETRDYCSGDPELEGLALRLPDDSPTINVMSAGYRPPVPDPSDVARRQPTLSLSQLQQIHRVLTSDIDTLIRDARGQVIQGGRPRLGL